MSNPFVGEIRIFGFNFAPKGWALCDGQLLPISQNTAVFSLLGTFYGGDGKSTFALPNLQGSVPIHQGQSPGTSLFSLGEQGGTETVTLLQNEMPAHVHTVSADENALNTNQPTPSNNVVSNVTGKTLYYNGAATTQMSPFMASLAGGDQPHNNMMPYITLNFCIALQGVYPPRT